MMFSSTKSMQVRVAALVAISWMAIGAIIFHRLEHWTWIESVYFAVVSLTTVGYGDLHPTTDFSRLVDVFYILFGVISVVTAVGIIGAYRVDKKTNKVEEIKERRAKKG